ncbi:MAG TPA: pyruvate formate lyase family protein [Candidatus Hydrogenedentes bacterium]|nr:pyruvate formate lyase family protein [Candidatus Hydrogenedentota bacterium]HPG70300.1 pyruvate formate lyase family protein [Candidatus Hydrogenedentota bacterium]
MDSNERIAALRARVLRGKAVGTSRRADFFSVVTARSLRASEAEASWQVRRGRLTHDRLAAVSFVMDDLEMLAGRLGDPETAVTADELDEARAYLAGFVDLRGQTGHCELDVEPVLWKGLDGLAEDLAGRLAQARGAAAQAYQSFITALRGLSLMIEHAGVVARETGHRDVAESCARIAHQPPTGFRDALQLLWFVILGVMHGDQVGLVVPGRLDRSLARFYASDRAAGRLSREDALLLVESLYLLVNDYIPDGLAMSVMVGGRDAAGHDVTNDLSYLCVEALRRTRLIYPTVGICWNEETPSDLIDLAVDLIGHGNPNPAFFGDETIQRGLRSLGVPVEEACHYINSTCVEITPACGSNVWVASPYFPTCRILLDEIADQVDRGAESPDFDTFYAHYCARLGQHIAEAVADQNEARRVREAHGRKPLQSVFTRDCVERGKDIDEGGARYNWVECSFVGLANLADSLYVIREEVFTRKRMSLAQIKAVLDADFEGAEVVRRRFAEGYPKYGHDNADVDALFAHTLQFFRRECARHRIDPDDSPFVPGAFCWVMHEVLGRECGATPDGRKAGTPFADGCGPAQGREACGPTAAILSTTSWDHGPMIGGLAYNMKFGARLFRSRDGFACVRHLILTFLRRGGFETQINVVDAETLKAARTNPEAHADLMVRIGGYSDYFTRLSPQMQDEIIMRTEFGGA